MLRPSMSSILEMEASMPSNMPEITCISVPTVRASALNVEASKLPTAMRNWWKWASGMTAKRWPVRPDEV